MDKLYRQFRFYYVAAVLFIGINSSVYAQETVQGVVRMKVTESLATKLESQAVARTSTGQVQTGVQSIDQLNAKFNIRKLSRVFPHAGKHEARHRKYGLHLWYEAILGNNVSVSSVLQSYRSEAQILRVEPVYKKALIGSGSPEFGPRIIKNNAPENPILSGVANDPMLASQWHYNNTGQTGGTPGADIDLFNAWKIETGRKDVIIAVNDGGIDINHPDLGPNLWANANEIAGNNRDDDNNGYVDDVHGFSFVHQQGEILPDNHGTHVAGTVAAVTNNNVGVAGVAGGSGAGDGVRVMSCAVFHADTLADGFAEAFVYSADNGAVISQNSWGYTLPGVFEQVVLDAIDYFIDQAGKNALGKQIGPISGGVVIFSAGNYNDEAAYFPASHEPIVAVASSTHRDTRSRYSNFGSWIDIIAPGGETYESSAEGVVSTLPHGNYGSFMGTSMACPHVSGVVGLIVSKFGRPGLSAQAVRQRLLESVDNIALLNPGFEGKLGAGRVNALVALGANNQTPPAAITDLKVLGKDIGEVTLTWTTPGTGAHRVSAYDLRYSTSPITPSNFVNATAVTGLPAPSAPGSEETFTVKDLPGGVLFYFAIRSQNFAGTFSALSNVASESAAETPVFSISPASLTVNLKTAERSSRELTITNKGKGPLKLKVSLSQTANPFATATPLEDLVSGGTSKPITVVFDAARLAAGTYQQTLNIETNDPANKSVRVTLTLTVTSNGAPIASIAPETLDFKSVQIGETQKQKVRVSNAGSEPLVISTVSSTQKPFTCVLETPITIPSFQYADINIAFTPERIGKFTAEISFNTNDPVRPTLKIQAQGEALKETPVAVSPNEFNETLDKGSLVTRTMVLRNNGSQDRDYRIEIGDNRLITQPESSVARKITASRDANYDSAIARNNRRLEKIEKELSGRLQHELNLVRSIGSKAASPLSSNPSARKKSTDEATEARRRVTGFEEFATGPLGEQHGWFASQGWTVDTANPRSGAKHLRGVSQPSGAAEKFALSPYLFEPDEYHLYPRYTSASMRINLDAARGTTWEIVPQDPWSYIATRIRFNADGSIEAFVIDNDYNFHWKNVPIQTPSGYFDFAIEYNNWGSDTSGFPTYMLFVNNQHVFSGTGLGSGIGQIAFVSPMETTGALFDVDDFSLNGHEYFQKFITPSAAVGTIPANGSINVSMAFDATVMKYGSYATDILVHVDETDTLTVPATLNVVGDPSMVWDLWSIDMRLEDGFGDWQQMTLTNTGGRDIAFNFETEIEGLTISPQEGVLKVRESKTLNITFAGTPGFYRGSAILHNDAGEDVIFPVDITVYEMEANFVAPGPFTVEVPSGEITTKTIMLKNEGKNPVSFYAGVWPEAGPVAIEPANGTIQDSLELILTIDARGLSQGTRWLPLEFVTNDINNQIVYSELALNVLVDTVREGKITRELWTNVPGREVSTIPLNTAPASTSHLRTFETKANQGDYYGSRIRGYVRPPVSGQYTFYIASDDHSELWLSTDESEENKRRIAWVNGFTQPREWTKYASQVSEVIWLEGDKKYYIEALHKEGTGGDHLSVGWSDEDNLIDERPLPSSRLIPYDLQWTNAPPKVQVLTPANGERFSAPANVEVTTYMEDIDGHIVKVDFFDGDRKLATDVTAPYSFVWKDLLKGSYSIKLKATDNRGAIDSTTINFVVGEREPPAIVLTSPANEQVFAAGQTIQLSASVTPHDTDVAKVEFFQGLIKLGEAATHPYVFDWQDAPAGEHSLTAMVTTNDGTTAMSSPVTINVEAICHASGTITREYWKKIKGNSPSRIPVHTTPDRVDELSAFEAGNTGHSPYGARIRGYICPPASGEYVFWIASSGKSELWLSSDDDPEKKKRIAMVRPGTKKHKWDKSSHQRSKPVTLEKGQTYYIESLHVHKKGDGHLAVGWQLPDGTLERPIAGSRLSPFIKSAGLPPDEGDDDDERKDGRGIADSNANDPQMEMQLYPNPVEGEMLNIVIDSQSLPENAIREVVIRQLTGLTVYTERQRCAKTCDTQVNVRNTLSPGVYILQVRIGEKVFTEKVLVR